MALFGLTAGIALEDYLLTNEEFLTLHGDRLLVINGIDMSTNNHDAGTRGAFSGKISGSYAALGALVAETMAPDKPFAFISAGGYDYTDGLVLVARIDNPTALQRIAFPNLLFPGGTNETTFRSAQTMTRIMRAQQDRIAASWRWEREFATGASSAARISTNDRSPSIRLR